MHGVALHQHKRKRKLKPYPHKNPTIRLVDELANVAILLFPLTTIPQLVEIWVYKQTKGVSIVTWGLFLLLTLPLLAYAYVHRERRLVFMWSLWVVVYTGIITGLLLYGSPLQ